MAKSDEFCVPQPKPAPRRKTAKKLRRSYGRVVPDEVREALWRRCGGKCEARTEACWGMAEHPHHRLLKAQGSDHDLEGLLAVCLACHDLIHASPALSYERGWLLRSTDPSPGHPYRTETNE